MSGQDLGGHAPEDGRPLRAGLSSDDGAASVSTLRASIPDAGDWIILRDWRLGFRQITKVTDKLFKLGDGSSRYPTQISKDKREIVAIVSCDRSTVERLCNSIAGIDGEFNRRRSKADAERNERVKAAADTRDRAIERLLAQGTEARRAETGTGSVHDGPVPQGCAPTSPATLTKEGGNRG